MFYILLDSLETRTRVIQSLAKVGISSVTHYVPLHSSAAGKKYGRQSGLMTITDDLSSKILRLPLWLDMGWAVSSIAKELSVLL
jgi:dTDP-4-amino-4,6-dideoxygalactose transaminase